MLVRFPQSLVIAEYFNYDRFGEIVLAQPLAGEPRPFTGTAIDAPGAAANARTRRTACSRITLDDDQSAQNPPFLRHPNGDPFTLANRFRGGDTVAEHGRRARLRLQPVSRSSRPGRADYTAANPRPAAPEPGRRHAPRRGDEHAQLLRHARHDRRDDTGPATRAAATRTSTAAARTPTSRTSSPPARQAAAGAHRAQRRHHRPQRAREHARASSRSAEHRRRPAGLRLHRHRARSAPMRSRSA